MRRGRVGGLALLGLALLGLSACGTALDYEAQAKRRAYQERYAKAKALFEERCKTAGVVIHRRVKDVEGIELTKIRPEIPWGGREYFDPMFPGAAMAGEVKGIDYIKQFLMYEFRFARQPAVRGQLGPPTTPYFAGYIPLQGYRFVEVIDADGVRYRYSPVWSPGESNWVAGQHKREAVATAGTRYALDFEDLVEPTDRQHWVAGTKLRVVDKQTREVIAELTRYVWDTGFGDGSTGRWPWQHASHRATQHCPSTVGIKQYASRTFVDTVLMPKQGD